MSPATVPEGDYRELRRELLRVMDEHHRYRASVNEILQEAGVQIPTDVPGVQVLANQMAMHRKEMHRALAEVKRLEVENDTLREEYEVTKEEVSHLRTGNPIKRPERSDNSYLESIMSEVKLASSLLSQLVEAALEANTLLTQLARIGSDVNRASRGRP